MKEKKLKAEFNEANTTVIPLYGKGELVIPEWIDVLLEVSHTPVIVFDEAYQLLRVNENFNDFILQPLSSIRKVRIFEFISAIDADKFEEFCHRLSRSPESCKTFEMLVRVGPDTYKRCNCKLRYSKGERVYVLCLDTNTHDLNELKEKAIRNELSLKSALNAVPSAFFSVNLNYDIFQSNDAFRNGVRQFFGRDIRSGELSADLFPREVARFWIRLFDRVVNGEHVGEVWTFKNRKFDVNAHPIWQGRTILGVAVSVIDSTLFYENQLQLNKLAEVVKSTEDYILLVDESNKIDWANSSFWKFYGSQPDQLMLHELWINTSLRKIERIDEKIRSHEAFKTWITIQNSEGNEAWADLTVQPILNSQGEFIQAALVLKDITMRVRQQKALNDRNLRLEKINRELDQFVYKVSHDLRAPVASALGITAMMRSEKNLEQIKHYSEMLEGSMNKLDHFIHSIVEHTQNERLEPKNEYIDLRSQLAQHIEEMEFSFSVEMQYSLEGEHDIPFWNDAFRVSTIFKNIISNAFRFHDRDKDIHELTVRWTVSDDKLEISFMDNGMGIYNGHLERIFDMFYRATDRYHGSGLGLYIVKNALTRLGGDIRVDSIEHVGSRFTICIPNRWREATL